MAPLAAATSKQYDATVVTALIMTIKGNGGTINEALRRMSALDGTRTVSGFEHSLRALNKLAGDLNAKEAAGGVLGPADMGNGGGGSAPATPKKRGGGAGSASSTPAKRARTSKTKKETNAVNGDDEGL